MDYQTLSAEDKLALAQDTLRARESDHFRLSLLDEETIGGPARLSALEAEIDTISKQVDTLKKEVTPKTVKRKTTKKAKDELPGATETSKDAPGGGEGNG